MKKHIHNKHMSTAINRIIEFLKNNKFVFLCVFLFLFQALKYFLFRNTGISKIEGDGHYYVESIENLINLGQYQLNSNFSGRMPGFLPIYYPLRLLFSKQIALLLGSFVQIACYCISVVFFGYTIKRHVSKSISAILVIVFLGLTDYISIYAFGYYTETLATACMLTGISFLLIGIKRQTTSPFFLSGLFIAWLVFLRPFMIVYFIFIIFFIIFIISFNTFKRKMLCILLFSLCFLFFDSIWVIRNYINEKKIIPLQSSVYGGMNYPKTYLKIVDFTKQFGGVFLEWHPGSEGAWFATDKYLKTYNFTRPSDKIFPEYIFNDTINLDHLVQLRNFYWLSSDTSLDSNTRQNYASLFIQGLDEHISYIQQNKKQVCYIYAPLILIWKFIYQPYTYYQPIGEDNRNIQLLFKGFFYLINAFVILGGFFSYLYFFFGVIMRKMTKEFSLLIFVPGFLIVLFPLYKGTVEYRYLVLAFPFFSVYISVLLSKWKTVMEKIKFRRRN